MDNDLILLGHGSGGKLSHQLLDELILPILSSANTIQNDAALLTLPAGRIAFTTDGYVVDPPIFPGGTIGTLAVNGTINDLAMMGATPLSLSIALIIEEGMSKKTLAQILTTMRQAADAANVQIVAGDTKVVPRGKADRIFITSSGIGVVNHNLAIAGDRARIGDQIIVSGTIGDHGMAILACREGLEMRGELLSDCAALHGLVAEIIATGGEGVHVLRDPTRGGVATTLKEIALQSQVAMELKEKELPLRDTVRGACAILGLDPLYVANEGKLLAIVTPEHADKVLAAMRRHPLGVDAAIIGEVTGGAAGRIELETVVGGRRLVEMLAGEQLPRIC